jgi:hypothetical protein
MTEAALFGSSLLPSSIWIGNYPKGVRGVHTVQLGEVVRRSFTDSGLTAERWNGIGRAGARVCAGRDRLPHARGVERHHRLVWRLRRRVQV